MISKNTIEKVFEISRVEEVIGEFIQLKKSGSNFKGLSPFTNEKTPSFMISPAGEIIKLGVFSLVNGLRPLKFEPDFFNCMNSPITSSTLEISKTFSMVFLDIKLIISLYNVINHLF